MLKETYQAFEIRNDEVSGQEIEGNLSAIADFIKRCHKDSIITIHTLEGEPFLIALSTVFLFCADREFLDTQLIPCMRWT